MAKVWIRDSMTWTTDVGSEDGWISFDLLYRARTGLGQGTGPDAAPARQVLPKGASPVSVHADLRVADPELIPTQLDLTNAKISRVRLEYGLIFAPFGATPPVAPNYEAVAVRGWYEGLIIAPFAHAAAIQQTGILGDPAYEYFAQALDWLWWDRKYLHSTGFKTVFPGASFLESALVYSEVDTRNSRTISEFGNSLYWCLAPSGPPPSPALPTTGMTINGGTASWSVLLELPD